MAYVLRAGFVVMRRDVDPLPDRAEAGWSEKRRSCIPEASEAGMGALPGNPRSPDRGALGTDGTSCSAVAER